MILTMGGLRPGREARGLRVMAQGRPDQTVWAIPARGQGPAPWHNNIADITSNKSFAKKIVTEDHMVPRFAQIACAMAMTLGMTTSVLATAGDWLNSLAERRYTRVRAELISTGYMPVRFSHASNRNQCSGREWCAIYPETEHCSGTGIALCQFVFFHRGSKRYLSVVTYGEVKLTVLRAYYLRLEERRYWSPHVP
jgi:hypothetical protein